MGLIKKIFGGIFGLIGGIFGGLAKLLGLGKKGEFYMELEEGNSSAAPAEAPAQPASTVKSEAAPAQTEKAPKPAPAQATVSPDKPLVTTNPQAAAKAASAEQSFATDYLVNPKVNNTSRRRPGPSVAPFKDMVRDMGKKSPSMG
jgi:predicted lipid-binding transport protein (Tim44 family)